MPNGQLFSVTILDAVLVKNKDDAADGLAAQSKTARLFIALDMLLRESNVGSAASNFGIHITAMSRVLGEIREHFDDRILTRTGSGMRPTPFADSIRLRVRALMSELQELTTMRPAETKGNYTELLHDWERQSDFSPVPLAVTPADRLEGTPTPQQVAKRLASFRTGQPHERLARYITLVAAGSGRTRTLSQTEACDALSIVLNGDADPVQIGAIFMTIQMRGPTAFELAGFAQAIQNAVSISLDGTVSADLDWPFYVSPRWRQPPWFILSAKLVARAGYRVLMHGTFGNGAESGKFELAASDAGIPFCKTPEQIQAALDDRSIAYTSIDAVLPQARSLLVLYPLFGTRTPFNSAIHLANPFKSKAVVVGAYDSSSQDFYADVFQLLSLERLGIIGSSRDLAEINPRRSTVLTRLVGEECIKETIPAHREQMRDDVRAAYTQRQYWRAVWQGDVRDALAQATIVRTAAAAIASASGNSHSSFAQSLAVAEDCWKDRERLA